MSSGLTNFIRDKGELLTTSHQKFSKKYMED